MKESNKIIDCFLAKGYTISEVAKLIDISEEELEAFINADSSQFEILSRISNSLQSVGEIVINEAPRVDGNNNVVGDGACNNSDEVIQGLMRIIEDNKAQLEAKDTQINILLGKIN